MLHFTKLTIENFGPFKGITEIDLSKENGVTIIEGNNGRGKTTLLNAFKYVLFGKPLTRSGITQKIKLLSNWESYDEGKYGLKVSIQLIFDGNNFEITRQYRVRNGVNVPETDNDYTEEVFVKREGSILSRDQREHYLNLIMPQDISRFFLFDGELLQEYEELLIDESKEGQLIKESIERILGVPILTNGLTDIKEAEEKYAKQVSKIAQKNKNTEVLGKLLEEKHAEKEQHTKDYEDLQNVLERLLAEKNDIEDIMKQTERARELLVQKEVYESNIEIKKKLLEEKLSEIQKKTKLAWQGMINQRIQAAIKETETEIKKFEEKKNNQLIVEQHAILLNSAIENHICPICEQNVADNLIVRLNEKEKELIKNGGLTQLEEEKLTRLNSRLSKLKIFDLPSSKTQIEALESTISEYKVEISDYQQRISEINKNLSEINDKEIARTIQNEYDNCIKKISNTENGIADVKQKIDEITITIKGLEEKLHKDATDQELIEIEKKREFSGKVKQIFEIGVDQYREKLKQKVEIAATEIFKKISNEPDYKKLEINENYGLSIIHNTGRNVTIRSAGYEHIVALSLIGALHKNSPLQGPIIMDSPFGRLDPDHKLKIISALPTLADQVILFVYHSEIDEQEARRILGSKLNNEYELERNNAFHTKITKR